MANGPTRATGYNSYASDGTSKFIPIVWSRKMLRNFYAATVFGVIANTDYEGEIKNQGDKVMIRRIPAITINDYTVGGTLTYEVPEVANRELNIDQAKSWSFRLDDVDKVQTDLPLMDKFAMDAGERLQITIDTNVLAYAVGKADSNNRGSTAGAISSNIDMGATGTNGGSALSVTKALATDMIVDVNQVLDEQNIPAENRFVVLPAWWCAQLKKSDLKAANITGDATGVIRNGIVGMVDRTKVIQSNNLYTATEGTATLTYALGGTKEAVTFALQLTKTESLRIPDSFGTYMRGLAVFGRAVVQPTALVEMVAVKG